MKENRCYKERLLVANFMKRLYVKHLVTAKGGNISMRLDKDHFLITPSGLDKGYLTAESIAIVTFEGVNETPALPLSIETEMHRQILLNRPDINAVIHAHPVMATALSTSPKYHINSHLSGETYYCLGDVKMVDYELMGTGKLATKVSRAIHNSKSLILQNHGAVTVGTTLLSAFNRMEVLERCAQMTLCTFNIPGSMELDAAQLKEIDNLH